MSTEINGPDCVEQWVVSRYGSIYTTAANVEGVFQVVAVSVPFYKGVATGLGPDRKRAIHDLYLELVMTPELPVELTGFWKWRRNAVRQAAGFSIIP